MLSGLQSLDLASACVRAKCQGQGVDLMLSKVCVTLVLCLGLLEGFRVVIVSFRFTIGVVSVELV